MADTRRWPLWLAVITGFVTCIAIWPPVGWVGDRLSAATGERLTLSGLQGSLWQGSAQVVLFDGSVHRALPGRVNWTVQPIALLRGSGAALVLEHPNLNGPLTLSRTDQGLSVSGGELQFPALWLEATGTPWNTLRPGGYIRLSWANVNIGQASRFQIRWQDAQSALSVVKPLGNYEAVIDLAPDGSLAARLNTLSGDLNLEGQANWSPKGGFGFSGYATASPAQQAALTGLLSQMGRLENNRYRLGS